jgi:acyl-CoA synthetase (AMP-forming)/AMP-acid ligase II
MQNARFSFETLREALDHRAASTPADLAYCFLKNGETEDGHFTFGSLRAKAARIGRALLASGVQPGDRILLLLPQSLDYVVTLYACFYAGLIAVPASPPSRTKQLARLQKIASDASAAVIISNRDTLEAFGEALGALTPAQCRAVEDIDIEAGDDVALPDLDGETIALLQYTSGSAGNPKGVIVTHRNLCADQVLLREALATGPHSTTVSWLPLFHDMGLIMGMMHPLFVGAPCYLMAPLAFLQKPARWLQAISRYRAQVSGAPNFAYDLAVTNVAPAERAGLDFSAWQVAFNAAEIIRPETLTRFTATYAAHGFRSSHANWCYGLAEATLIVTGGPPGAVPCTLRLAGDVLASTGIALPVDHAEPGSRLVASCGRPLGDVDLVIADPATHCRLNPGSVGEVWLAGPIVAKGYWGNPEATAEIFGAHLATGEGPYLRTGDMGFMSNGALFLTSRLKDLIIIRGRNYSPSDIEQAIESADPAIRENGVAAFTIMGENGEELVVAAEITQETMTDFDPAAVIRKLRAEIVKEFDLRLSKVAFVRRGKLPRTTSGKIQRAICRRDFEAGALALAERPLVTG